MWLPGHNPPKNEIKNRWVYASKYIILKDLVLLRRVILAVAVGLLS